MDLSEHVAKTLRALQAETQVLDYPLHQRRLLPLMAQAIAMGFTALRFVSIGCAETLDAN